MLVKHEQTAGFEHGSFAPFEPARAHAVESDRAEPNLPGSLRCFLRAPAGLGGSRALPCSPRAGAPGPRRLSLGCSAWGRARGGLRSPPDAFTSRLRPGRFFFPNGDLPLEITLKKSPQTTRVSPASLWALIVGGPERKLLCSDDTSRFLPCFE